MLLVEVQAAGINYADVLALSGQYPAITKAPFALGFEIAGVVQQVGENVEGFKVGDPVAALTLTGGGYASHILIPAATAILLPRQLDPALAVAVLLQGLTAYILLDRAQVKDGDVVMVAAAAGGVERGALDGISDGEVVPEGNFRGTVIERGGLNAARHQAGRDT